MSPHVTSAQQQKSNILSILPLILFLILCGAGIASNMMQSSQKEEREVEDKTPSRLPIKFKVKNPDKVKDMQNED